MTLMRAGGSAGGFRAIDPHVRRVAVVIVLGSIMSILDTTIVNVALDSLSKDLHSSLSEIQWVVSAYLLALAAVIPVTAWAVRRYSAFRVYMWALVLFTLGSLLCGLATSTAELIAFRVLQGVGGGMLVPTGLTILVHASGPKNLAKVMSAIGVPMVLAPVFGPTLGGLLLQTVSWHAIFMINVPLGIATAFVAMRLLPRDHPDKGTAGSLDWQGLVLAATGTVGVTYGLSESANTGSVTSPSVVWPIVVGLMLVGAFVLRTRRVANPLLDLKLYRIKAYSSATVVMFCLGAAMFGAMILLPLYFQVARGESAVVTGLMLIPQGVGASIGMNRSALATGRFGAGLTSLCGGIVMVMATVPFLFITDTTPYALIASTMVLRGVGVGLAMMPAMTAAFGSLRHEQINDASPQINVIQRVGGSLGTAVIAVVLQDKLTHLGTSPSSSATAGAFAQTYWWVVAMTVLALIPAAVLWRVERSAPAVHPDESEMDAFTIEALA
jgi:EmrB/QacA subfamily drug resistance transporter